MNSESRRKASATFHAARKAAGWRKVTVWLDPESAFKVDALKAAAGSADEVHRQAIKAWPGPAAEVIVEPPKVAARKPPPAPKDKPAKAQPPALQFGSRKADPGSRLKGAKG